MQDNDTLFVTYASDDNYAKYLGISLLSLFRSNTEFNLIQVFVLDCGIDEKNKENLRRIACEFCREIKFLPLNNAGCQLKLKNITLGVSIAYYARLFLASLLPKEIERVLYLDCDTLILSSLKEMWGISMGKNFIAGVQDTVDVYFQKVIGLNSDIRYLNSGVLLIDLRAWREENLEEKFIDFIKKFNGNVPHHDQGTINGVCKERRYILPPRCNAMSNIYSLSASTIKKIYFLKEYYTQSEIDEAIHDPAIIHFTIGLVGRPWEEGCTHPAKDDYLELLRQSPWKNDSLLPDTRKKSVKAFKFYYEHVPLILFEKSYMMFCWLLHIKS